MEEGQCEGICSTQSCMPRNCRKFLHAKLFSVQKIILLNYHNFVDGFLTSEKVKNLRDFKRQNSLPALLIFYLDLSQIFYVWQLVFYEFTKVIRIKFITIEFS